MNTTTFKNPPLGRAFRYELSDTLLGSQNLGPCEVCMEPCGTVFHQIEERRYTRADGSEGWTRHGCHNLFGHESCLQKLQKREGA